MGKIRVNRHGNLYFDFFFQGIRCYEGVALPNTPANRKRLNARMQVIDEQIAIGTFDYCSTFPGGNKSHIFKPLSVVGKQLFDEYFERWLKKKYDPDRKENEIKKGTWLLYKEVYKNYLKPYFGAMALKDIDLPCLISFSDKLAGKSSIRIRHIIAPLRGCLNDAADRGIIEHNPWKKKVFGKLRIPPKEIQPFSLEDVAKFLERCSNHYREYFIVAFYAGMRPSEQIALKWGRVDFDRGYFRVLESRTKGEDGRPKTAKSTRDVKMTPAVYDAFLSQKEKTFTKSEYVFLNEEGGAISLDSLRRHVWHTTLKNAELAYRNPYQSRHTAITLMLMAGENPYWVAEQTGTSAEMIWKHYFKYIQNMGKKDGDAFGKMITSKVAQETEAKNGGIK